MKDKGKLKLPKEKDLFSLSVTLYYSTEDNQDFSVLKTQTVER